MLLLLNHFRFRCRLHQQVREEHWIQKQHRFLDFAKAYDFKELWSLLDEEPELVNAQPLGRWSALHQAVHANEESVVRRLLECRASVRVSRLAYQDIK